MDQDLDLEYILVFKLKDNLSKKTYRVCVGFQLLKLMETCDFKLVGRKSRIMLQTVERDGPIDVSPLKKFPLYSLSPESHRVSKEGDSH